VAIVNTSDASFYLYQKNIFAANDFALDLMQSFAAEKKAKFSAAFG
jgi:hypothetical protein